MTINLMHGDCLALMKTLPDKSVHLILCDLPYGTTACHWDTVIPFEALWAAYSRIITDTGVIVLTASQPFTSKLVCSNMDMFKYCLVWRKNRATNFFNAKNRPLTSHEDICVFSKAGSSTGSENYMTYNPQGLVRSGQVYDGRLVGSNAEDTHKFKRSAHKEVVVQEFSNYPQTVLDFGCVLNGVVHPTQKPVPLFEYLVKTYSNEGDTVLDNCMGSGTTAIACIQANRHFIGMEKEEKYFKLAEKRINDALSERSILGSSLFTV